MAAVAASVVVPATGQARSLGTSFNGSFLTDRQRYVVTQPEPRLLQVADLRTGTAESYSLPCEMASMGLRSPVLLRCVSDDQTRVHNELLYPATGERREVPATDIQRQFSSIGRYWMQAVAPCGGVPSGQCDLYENWRTGEQRTGGEAYESKPLDLDSVSLKPVRGGYLGSRQHVGLWRLHRIYRLYGDTLILKRKGRTVARQEKISGDARLTRRAASWSAGDTLYVRPLSAERTFKKRFPGTERVTVSQVGDSIVYGVQADPPQLSARQKVTVVSLSSVQRHWR